MIMTLQNAMVVVLPSVDGGRSRFALGLVDELAGVDVVVLVVEAGREVVVVELVELACRRARVDLGRPLDAGDEVAEDLLGDEQGVLELDDRLGRGLEQDDVVRALAVAVDRVGQPAAAPRGDLDDLAAGGDDAGGWCGR